MILELFMHRCAEESQPINLPAAVAGLNIEMHAILHSLRLGDLLEAQRRPGPSIITVGSVSGVNPSAANCRTSASSYGRTS
jgi:hypothetical protein